MIIISLLAISALITLAKASPMSYATYRRRELPMDERPELLLLYDQRGLENTDPPLHLANDIDHENPIDLPLQDEIVDVGNNRGSSLARSKKLRMSRTSLSIVNPLDVLRDRVMLELARRKAMQDQRQIDANRRLLQEIGKRSFQNVDPGYPRASDSVEIANNRLYTNEHRTDNQQQIHHPYTQRIPIDDPREWYNVDESVIRGSSSSSSSSSNSNSNGDDETPKVLSTYHHDRI